MDLSKDTWEIINSYFKDTENFLVKHHIDSYNDFIKNKIPLVFKNYNHQKVFRFDKENPDISYIANIYYGGKNANKYKISKPIIINHQNGENKQMYPNEARLKNLTYGFDFFFDVDVEFTIKKGDKIILDNEPIHNNTFLKNIYLGRIPIMLHSDLCILSNMEDEVLNQMGECRYDPGGYFIIDGREKIIISLERKAENIIFLNKITDSNNKYTHVAEIKSISNEAFTYSRTVKLQKEKNGPITVRLGQNRPFLQPVEGRDVPLFIMFRAMGIETDKEILTYILGDLNTSLSKKMIKILHPSIVDPYIVDGEIYDKDSADAYLERLPSRAVAEGKDKISEIHNNKSHRLALLYQALQENFLPHCGNDFKAKAFFLAYMTKKLLLRILNLEDDTDRDNFCNKRIDISGFMLSTLFRDAFQQLQRSVKVEISRIYEFNFKEYSEEKFPYIINENNYFKIFNQEVFKQHFIDSIKRGTLGAKQGVVQSMERVNYYATLSHLRRIADPASGSEVTLSRRRLHTTQYGGICPFETPDGQNVGLRKALSMTALITFGISTDKIINLLTEFGLLKLNDLLLEQIVNYTKIFLNGNIIGFHKNGMYLYQIYKLYRRNGLINIYSSISFDNINNEIKIFTDNGRIVRPLYIVENNELLLQPKHIEKIKNNKLKFLELVVGFSDKKNMNLHHFISNEVNELKTLGINREKDDIISILKENQSVIEYLDTHELAFSLLTRKFDINNNDNENYTHTELHPSMSLGMCANLIPFIQNASSPRGIYASKQIKQGAGMYATNFKNRIDTSVHLLHYPNKPLTLGRLHKFLNNDKMGTGQNVCVAICHYNGCNADDGIIGNKTSVQMGLFNSSYFKMYEEVEKNDSKKNMSEKFYNPLYEANKEKFESELKENNENNDNDTSKLVNSELNYQYLDKYGLIKEGTYLEGNEVLIGKYLKVTNETNQEVISDISKKVKKDNVNSVVDKVYTTQINANGDRLAKIRTCQYRYPVIGDKMASRCAQKGTFGILLDKEDMPYSEDGIVPDLLLTPYGYPSRMTVNQFLEILLGNLASELGFFGLGSPLEPINPEQVNDILCDKLGLSDYGDRILYNGFTGEQMNVKIYTGVIYYQRLKYMVNDKINTRLSGHRENGIPMPGGAYTVKERQVVPGRALGGGLRMGEMERDVMISHGTMGFFKESIMERCDKFYVYVSSKTGELCFVNPEENLYFDASVDGPVNYQLKDDSTMSSSDSILGINVEKQTQTEFHRVEIPYALKLLVQELQGLCINVRIKADKLKLVLNMQKIEEDTLNLDTINEELLDDDESELFNEDEEESLEGDELVLDVENEEDEENNIDNTIDEDDNNIDKEQEGGAVTFNTNNELLKEENIQLGGTMNGNIIPGENMNMNMNMNTNNLIQENNHQLNMNQQNNQQNNQMGGGDSMDENYNEEMYQTTDFNREPSIMPNLNPDIDTNLNQSGGSNMILNANHNDLNRNDSNNNSNNQNFENNVIDLNLDGGGQNNINMDDTTEQKSPEIKTITIEGGSLNQFGNFNNVSSKKKKGISFTEKYDDFSIEKPNNNEIYSGSQVPNPFQ